MTFNFIAFSDLITESARSALDEWDINKTIEEVKNSPEIKELNREIEYLKAIKQIFNK